jgi:hypothetical protein
VASTARFLWQRLEAYHGLIYFVPEADRHYTALGLDPGRMGYFGSRAAAMGPVPAHVVVATFFNFNPELVHAVVPEVWNRTTAPALWDARLGAVDDALGRLFAERLRADDIRRAADLLRGAVGQCRPDGRPLFAGHLAQQWPDEAHLALWFGITLLREYRGDGHIAALTHAGLSGLEALVLHGATGAVPPAVLQSTRGWSDSAWTEARTRLEARGWLDATGALTDAGRAHRDGVERATDELAAAPWAVLSADEVEFLGELGKELSGVIAAAGTFPRR